MPPPSVKLDSSFAEKASPGTVPNPVLMLLALVLLMCAAPCEPASEGESGLPFLFVAQSVRQAHGGAGCPPVTAAEVYHGSGSLGTRLLVFRSVSAPDTWPLSLGERVFLKP